METTFESTSRLANEPSDRGRRWASLGVRVGWVTALCWAGFGLESIIRPEQENYRDLVWVLPFALTAVTFSFVHAAQRPGGGRVERWGYAGLMVSMALVVCGNVGLLLNRPLLAVLSFPWGALLWTAALVIFGVGTWRAGVLPRYAGVALILLEPGSILAGLALSPIAPLHERGGYSAGVEKGIAVAVVTFGLQSLLRRTQAQPKSQPPTLPVTDE